MGTRTEDTMRVHVHTKFCFLCVLTFLFQQCSHCHSDGHSQQNHAELHSDRQISQVPYLGGVSPSPGVKSPTGDLLEAEQRFYIQQLFRRYGQKDRLDFHGFQSLLLSLGLGEVKTVGMEHDDLGHDHVAHLDLLDVQEGLHSHSPGHDDHDHDHDHDHGHKHPHQKPNAHHHPHTEPDQSQCSQQTSEATPTADSGSLKDDDHKDHHHHTRSSLDVPPKLQQHTPSAPTEVPQGPGTLHPGAETPAPHPASTQPSATSSLATHTARPKRPRKPTKGRGQRVRNGQEGNSRDPGQGNSRDPGNNHENSHDLSHDHGNGHDHSHDHGNSHDPTHDHSHDHGNSHDPTHDHSQDHGNSHDPTHDHSQDHDHDHGSGHSHKDKREAPGEPVSPTQIPPRPALSGHPEGLSHQHEECLNLTQLLHYYGLSSDSLISPSQFTYLCPALLYQIDSRVCIRHYHHTEVEQEALEPVTSVWVWVWGFVSITIISLLSLLGVVLVPILNQACFKFLLTFLVALAVGTLSGDALLHLLPHSQGQHDHSHGEAGQAGDVPVDLLEAFDGVWKGLTALAGIYLLFIIEHCIGMVKHFKDQGGSMCGKNKRAEEAKIGRKLSDHKLNRRSDAEWLHLKPLTEGGDSSAVSCDNGHNDTQLSDLQTPDSPTNKTPLAPAETPHSPLSPATENGRKAKRHRHGHGHGHSHGHSHGGNCHSDQEMKDAGIASIAWMVIMGDGMHNFSDGLAIGAAFSANITGGISTSVAVFCHELPHELGDFAVLLKAGMSVKQAIVYNLLSALMAYVGMLIGTAVGQYTHNVTSWIFAITAGMFLYVALVDMLPEMLHGDSEDHKRCQLGHFVLQNLGMLTGFGIMLLIAIFEDQIVLDFGF